MFYLIKCDSDGSIVIADKSEIVGDCSSLKVGNKLCFFYNKNKYNGILIQKSRDEKKLEAAIETMRQQKKKRYSGLKLNSPDAASPRNVCQNISNKQDSRANSNNRTSRRRPSVNGAESVVITSPITPIYRSGDAAKTANDGKSSSNSNKKASRRGTSADNGDGMEGITNDARSSSNLSIRRISEIPSSSTNQTEQTGNNTFREDDRSSEEESGGGLLITSPQDVREMDLVSQVDQTGPLVLRETNSESQPNSGSEQCEASVLKVDVDDDNDLIGPTPPDGIEVCTSSSYSIMSTPMRRRKLHQRRRI